MQQQFRCPRCSAEFPTQQALNEHVQKEHMGTELEPPEQSEPGASPEFPSDEALERSGAYEPHVPVPERD